MFSASLIANSCSDLSPVSNLPFDERIVLRGIVDWQNGIDSIFVGRTIPTSANPTGVDWSVSTAEVTATVRDTVFALSPKGNGVYGTSAVTLQGSDAVELNVKWNGKTAMVSTVVPDTVHIDTFFIREIEPPSAQSDGKYVMEVWLRPRPNEAYSYFIDVTGAKFYYPTSWIPAGSEPIARWTDTMPDGLVHLKQVSRLAFSGPPPFHGTLYVHSFEVSYYDFFKGYYSRSGDDELYGNSDRFIKWNVQGDGVGEVVGRAVTTRQFP